MFDEAAMRMLWALDASDSYLKGLHSFLKIESVCKDGIGYGDRKSVV